MHVQPIAFHHHLVYITPNLTNNISSISTMQSAAGYSCEFVDEIPKEIQTECSICLQVLRQPHIVECCGQRYCESCLKQALQKSNRSCPLCNHQNPRSFADKQLARTLNEKKVKCTHKDSGCMWIGELAMLEDHILSLDGCRFQCLKCRYCQTDHPKTHIEDHELNCPSRPVICEYCKEFQCLRYELDQHVEECSHYPMACPKGCGLTIPRVHLDAHYQEWCPFTIVECEYAYAGCEVKVNRRDMTAHSELAMRDHLHLLTEKYFVQTETLKTEIEEIREEGRKKLLDKNQELDFLKQVCAQRGESEFSAHRFRNQILVAHLPLEVTENMLKGLFGVHGSVYAVKLYEDILIAVIGYKTCESVHAMFKKYNSTGINLLGSKLKCFSLDPDIPM